MPSIPGVGMFIAIKVHSCSNLITITSYKVFTYTIGKGVLSGQDQFYLLNAIWWRMLTFNLRLEFKLVLLMVLITGNKEREQCKLDGNVTVKQLAKFSTCN